MSMDIIQFVMALWLAMGQTVVQGGAVIRGGTQVAITPTTAISLSASTLAFGNRPTGTIYTAPMVETVTNIGSNAVTISSITTTTSYTETDNCVGSLAAGAHCAINVTFAPASAILYSGTLTINSTAPSSPDTASTTGTGFASLFQNGFETGDFSAWGSTSGLWTYDNPFINSTAPYVHSGMYSYGNQFGPVTGAADINRYNYINLTGQTEVWVRGYVYIKSPEADATPPLNSINQRKLIEVGDSTNSGCCGTWSPILDAWNDVGGAATNNNQLEWEEQPCGGTGVVYYNIGVVPFNAWHEVEAHIKLNTTQSVFSPASDGVVDVWLDGVKTFTSSTENIRGTCSTQLQGYFFGRQEDNPAGTTVDEYRYWDDIVIANQYIVP